MKYGYIRVSTKHQNLERQMEELKPYSCDEIIQEKMSGKNISDRPLFTELLNSKLKPGDTLVVSEMSRISRSLADFMNIVEQIRSKKCTLILCKETMTITPDDSASTKFILNTLSNVAEYERELMLERQADGIALAKAEGKYKGRRPVKRDPDNLNMVFEGYINNTIKLEKAAGMIMNLDNNTVGVTIPTFYRLLDNWCKENGYKRCNKYEKEIIKEVDDFLQNYKL